MELVAVGVGAICCVSRIASIEGASVAGVELVFRPCDQTAWFMTSESGVIGAVSGGVVDGNGVMADGGALMPRVDMADESLTGMPGDGCCEDEDSVDGGRRRSEMAWAMRNRFPNWGMSSSLSKFASSSSSRSPVISCSEISSARRAHSPLNLWQTDSSNPLPFAQSTTSLRLHETGGLPEISDWPTGGVAGRGSAGSRDRS